jgi:hypothetical protein
MAHPVCISTPLVPRHSGRVFGQMNSSAAKPLQLARSGGVVLSVLLSLFIGFTAQASSANYQRLFVTILPFAAVDVALVVFLFLSNEKGKIWFTAVPAILGFASYSDMACRVLLGVRLL